MRAIIIKQFGGSDKLKIEDIEIPSPKTGEILIRIKAFGINRSETYMRQGMWGEVAKVTGIECVGIVENDPSGKMKKGQTVAAIMGGMGRTRNGSYAEFTCISSNNVFELQSSLDWSALAAIPESYATAWACLHQNMKIMAGDTVFIRGGTSALGLAAINIAANMENVTVISSTRKPENKKLLLSIGCKHVLIENEQMSQDLKALYPEGVSSVLDIVGISTLLDSLQMVKTHGYICFAGFLGGGEPIKFFPPTNLPTSVNLNFFGSFMFGSVNFPLKNIPMQSIVTNVEKGIYKAVPSKIFNFDEVPGAHNLMESNTANGKIVVVI